MASTSQRTEDNVRRQEPTTARRSYVAVFVVVLAAYLPFFLSPAFGELVWWRPLLLVGLGLAYTILGTLGWERYERHPNRRIALAYFGLQIVLMVAILLVSGGVFGSFWLLAFPIAAQSVSLSRPLTTLVVVSILVAFSLVGLQFGMDLAGSVQLVVGVAAGIVFVVVFTQVAMREAAAREEVERLAEELGKANRQLRRYALQVEELATMQERNRLAREIHDSLGHYLTALNMQLGAAEAVFDEDRARALDALVKARKLAKEGLAEVRRSVSALRDSPTGGRPLPQAMTGLVAEAEAAGLVASLEVKGSPRPLDAREELTLFRAAQEALTNVRKHAHASRVDVLLDYTAPDTVCLLVCDNGVGAAATAGGFGLLGLRERVALLEGELRIETAVGKGFELEVRLPATRRTEQV